MKHLHQNREISTLAFNERVLQEAEDARNPLMERVKFLGIYSSNMDEFFKVRVASLYRMEGLGEAGASRVLEFIGEKSAELDLRFQAAYRAIMAGLEDEGVRILTEADLDRQSPKIRDWLQAYFRDHVLPSLVPLIIDERREFPQLVDGELYFAVKMGGEVPRYSILRIPSELGRFVELPNGHIMYLDDAIRNSLDEVYYIFDYDSIDAYEFKILRDAELDMDNDFSEDYVRRMEEELQQRKGGRPTRIAYDANMPPVMQKLLFKELAIGKEYPRQGGGRYHNMRDLIEFPNHRPDLSFAAMPPVAHPVLDHGRVPMLDTIYERDILITYPYQSFDHVIRLLREAAIDPKVEVIKMSLYRVAENSQVVNALVNAAGNGKLVFVSIELQARFDEQRNITIAERLQEAGAVVVYGIPPMKVHSKLMLIQRGGEYVAGLSTGNFNEATGHSYVDTTLFTADPRLTREVEAVFGILERASRARVFELPKFKRLLVSPINVRKVLTKQLAKQAKLGEGGYVFLKVNHLTDKRMIQAIRKTADAGVQMDLVVRTTYAMRPHPNIRAISILDRLLEHQRVYIFGRGEKQKVYLSSADFMERNLDWRLEVAFPVYDDALKQEIVDMMNLQIVDRYKARLFDETQSNLYVGEGEDGIRAQHATYEYFKALAQAAVARPRLVS